MKEYELQSLKKFHYPQYTSGCNVFFQIFKQGGRDFDFKLSDPALPDRYAADTITLQHLYDLEDLLRPEEPSLSRDDQQFFKGLVISYGLESVASTSLKLIYRPVYADISRLIAGGGSFVMEFVFSSLGKPTLDPAKVTEYFTWDGAAWKPLTNDEAATWQKNYQSVVQISRDADGIYAPFEFGMKDSDDARGVFFSFQEVRKFFQNPAAPPIDPATTTIYVTNIAESDPYYQIYKHTIAFSNTKPGAPIGAAISANFGTLCPPGTGSVMVSNMSKMPIPNTTLPVGGALAGAILEMSVFSPANNLNNINITSNGKITADLSVNDN